LAQPPHPNPLPKGEGAGRPFTIVIPPPNVTGALHLGHALNDTLQDIVIRFRRMQGYNTLWMPGTDHAGIATQAVVERKLKEEENLDRHKLGREGLVKRIWEWKEKYGARILEQFRQMGFSCDWRRTRFTLDDMCARAVRQTFFKMFKDGLIFRGKRLVNWDTHLQTAVADDEVYHETVKGHFWHIRYPVIPLDGAKVASDEPKFVTIATTRPETMLGDTAVAVHPDPAAALNKVEAELREKLASAPAKEKAGIQAEIDAIGERRKTHLPLLIKLRDMAIAGRKLKLPLANREIPLLVDSWAKPELGSGCVKITPAHDENDYQVWQRHKEIGAINIMNADGLLNDTVPEKYRGLKMHTTARNAVVADLVELKLHDPETERENREIDLAHSDRSKTPIEPYLADQWFVRMGDNPDGTPGLAQKCMDAVIQDHKAATAGRAEPSPQPSPKGRGSQSEPSPSGRGQGEGAGESPKGSRHPHPNPLPKGEGAGKGKIQILPTRYTKSYLDWLGEKRDWCIGRQLWWGHRVPVWHLKTSDIATYDDEMDDCSFIDQMIKELKSKYPDQIASEYYNIKKSVQWITDDRQPQVPGDRGYRICIREDNQEVLACLEEFGFTQDTDVLDTWFSSALWPMSTLGWPGPALADQPKGPNNPEWSEQQYYYPTSVLITSREIITLWVARMVLMGLYNLGKVPFHEVYIHPKILDGYGETMSKSKGNGVDPLDIISKFGTDALRFGLAYMATETQDVRMPVEFECPHCQKLIEQTQKNRMQPRVECKHCGQPFSTQWATKPEDVALPRAGVVSERFEVARNFCNKLWNASRFALLNLEGYEKGSGVGVQSSAAKLAIEDRWILSRLSTVTSQVTAALEQYKFADAARVLYDFTWDEFCSFYVEMVKTRLQDEKTRPTAQRILAYTLDTILRLLHPMAPFITEEVWQRLNDAAPERGLSGLGGWGRPTGAPSGAPAGGSAALDPSHPSQEAESVMIAPWPEANETLVDEEIEARFAKFQEVLRGIREVRARQGIGPKVELTFSANCNAETAAMLEPMRPYFASMAGADATEIGPGVKAPPLSAHFAAAGIDIYVDMAAHIDVPAEIERKKKERTKFEQQIAAKQKQLANEAFVSRAPEAVIAKERAALKELEDNLQSTIAMIELLEKTAKQ
jgi:valyl-tRNA synthetase